jgi:hypothetical protein
LVESVNLASASTLGNPDVAARPIDSYPTDQAVENRCVFYISGFDPRGARHYHSLFRTEIHKKNVDSAESSKVNVSPRKALNQFISTWFTDSSPLSSSLSTRAEFQFLGWDDIARLNWPTSRLKHWIGYVKVSGRFLFSSFFSKGWKSAIPAAIYLIAPNLIIFLTLLSMVLILGAAYWSITTQGKFSGSAVLVLFASVLGVWSTWRLAHWFEASRRLDWIMRSHAFTARQAYDEVPEIDQRIDAFAAQIIQRVCDNKDDEILIVGHSSGSILALSALARAIAKYPQIFQHKAKVSLLTLGQCTALLSLLPRAKRFRQELTLLSRQVDLLWVDLSSNADHICTSRVDQFKLCGIPTPPIGQGIKVCMVSPPFYLLNGVGGQTKQHTEIFDLHFQYLKHFQVKQDAQSSLGHDNYLNISTGAQNLQTRFEPHIPIPMPQGFEASVYLRLNPDVAQSGVSAEDHYRLHGKRERRSYLMSLPVDFDSQSYLDLNPDVAQAGVPADLHYLLHGIKENRPYRTV